MDELLPPESQIPIEEGKREEESEGKRCFIFSKDLTKLKEETCKQYTPSTKSDISEKDN